ncbi:MULTISPECIES: cupin-like domain-containing protein [unclassified Pseudoalteromonas]|uniref:cupin-like domain-containing protein n=1 Tax=unclassified Pseudoalteromonas TaxID=194690 RepID=UPI001F3B578D|nr:MULTISPECIES: cupin-like domain-containing protein [unclassified Pseudoalteromonas]MCF2825938.1 cupin-like domain-containing protein [Pseudoalteromonas sp. OF5H-5]MCF2829960.1 cupin-like domain-containing protein [Pseudoalteromonas sp. DL2-H6]MCF2925403.1 cupin-like domain-containing protein [Pseudoalteromonas sp. DL2-H1]
MTFMNYKQLIPCIEFFNPTAEEITRCMEQRQPFIIRGGAANWVARTKWTWEFFKRNYGHHSIKVYRSSNDQDNRYMSLAEYIDYITSSDEKDPYYASAWQFSLYFKELVDDYQVDDYFSCIIRNRIDDDLLHDQAALLLLRWIYMGPKNSGSRMHLDIASTHAWNAVISGRKEWVFYGPEEAEKVGFGQVNAVEPDLDRYPMFHEAKGVHCIQNPGDVIFTPCTHYHQIRNLEAGISITENFVNATNCNEVKHALMQDEDISPEQASFIKLLIPEFA